MTNTNKFRVATNNRAMTRALFLETYEDDGSSVLYTLKGEDTEFQGRAIPSLKRLYLQLSDPTEYQFAVEYFDGWDHWETLCSLAWFKPYIEKWRRELNIKIRSEAIGNIRKEAKSSSKNSFQANKFLVDKGWAGEETKGSWKMGRPSKEAIKEEAAKMTEQFEQIENDFRRLNIN